MKAAGIVAEFNPLHNGHVYMMKEARRISGADAVAVAMSGNFVQRGQAALINKWSRTKNALLNGADLVLEIPTLFCLQNAGGYASAGVRILEALGCDCTICCGAASTESEKIREIADIIRNNREYLQNKISEAARTGLSYPAAREKAVLSLAGPEADREVLISTIRDPNNILAIEYMLASDKSDVVCIPRIGAAYNDDFSSDNEYQSAGGIRKLLKDKAPEEAAEMIRSYVPQETYEDIRSGRLVFREDVSEYLKLSIINKDASEIDECPSGGEGLGNLLKEASVLKESMDDIISYAKSKRYTYTRLSRLCMQVLLGIDRRNYSFEMPEYIRVLGFNAKGRELLSEIKRRKSNAIPIITNINKECPEPGSDAEKMLMLDVKASDVYNLLAGKDTNIYSDYRKTPVMINL